MNNLLNAWMRVWARIVPNIVPFSDVASPDFPLHRILRLSLFQISVGMAVVLLTGTLNRVMVVELGVPVWLVAVMISIPLVFAPLRVLIGHRSDYHRSAFGLRRIPYIWSGTLLQFGGFAIMPYALLVLSDPTNDMSWLGQAAAAVGFLLVGAGLHTTQTAGLALASDLAPPDKRPRVVALLYVTLLLGMSASALLFGFFLEDFTHARLVAVVQGVAVVTVIINLLALWKQEAVNIKRAIADIPRPPFIDAWREFAAGGRASRLLVVVALATAGFNMQDLLLEPYGGQILGMTVAETTRLTAIYAAGTLLSFWASAYLLGRFGGSYHIAAYGALIGIAGLMGVILAASIDSGLVFRLGAGLIGFGSGFFVVGSLTAAMGLAKEGNSGLALGAWGAVQATTIGVSWALGGILKTLVAGFSERMAWTSTDIGHALMGYKFVYSLEILLLIAALVVIVPLVRNPGKEGLRTHDKVQMEHMP
ncbi:BCD family MFS transporter [Thiorhodospira sibirica]|uniref:BCD family MFS transporter n=1 Tax=Thiorhodospira sibirica TaxID=154347 RepID=UPI00022C58BE|nr:BCD family MFS transporter [Thiorhodospira sibirica]